MPLYQYNAKDPSGNQIKDKIEADNENIAVEKLTGRGFFITSIEEFKDNNGLNIDLNLFKQRVSAEIISTFFVQLSIMIKSGISLVDALKSLENSETNKRFLECIDDLRNRIYNGSSFSEALSHHYDIFDRFTVSMIRIGETGGVLEQVLVRLAATNKRKIAIKRQLIGAFTYPSILMFVAFIVLFVLMTFAVPRFADLFAKGGIELPWATKALIQTSDYLAHNYVKVLIGIAISVFILIYYAFTDQGQSAFGELSLSIPVIKEVTKRFYVVQIAESMGLLLQAGVPLRELLIAIENTIVVPTPKNTVRKMIEHIDQGSTFKKALENDPIFPPMAQKLIETGEATGSMDSMFNEIASYYDEQLSVAIKSAMTLIEPILIVVMALLVGFIMLAVFIPLFKMSFIRAN